MDVKKFETLACGGLWLSRLDTFGTKYEGSLPAENRVGLLRMLPDDGVVWVAKQYDLSVLRTFASCWHLNSGAPDRRVWQEFDKGGQGLAVLTTYDQLAREIAQTSPVNEGGPTYAGAVRYINHATDQIPDWNVLEAAFVVRDKWCYQTEVPVLVHTHGTAACSLHTQNGPKGPLVKRVEGAAASASSMTEFTGGHADGKAIVFAIDPRRLIVAIVPNRTMTHATMWKLLVVSARSGLACRVRPRGPVDVGMQLGALMAQVAFPSLVSRLTTRSSSAPSSLSRARLAS
jgi:hypothetical protein